MPKGRRSQKHLHGRGEDRFSKRSGTSFQETPPRTWRRLITFDKLASGARNTSTDVEKTKSKPYVDLRFQKHLHGRGEDAIAAVFITLNTETPPRTWRRPRCLIPNNARNSETPPRTWRRRDCNEAGCTVEGNTSTDVEKTQTSRLSFSMPGKHLHGRGEDRFPWLIRVLSGETPPRTWRRPSRHGLRRLRSGNTSTDVEKTRNI